MHFIFLTRCYTPVNINTIKQNIKEIFDGTEHTYEHLIVVDLSNVKDENEVMKYIGFSDELTSIHFIDDKPENDSQNTYGMNKALDTVTNDGYVYVLDDDNLLHKYFLDICKDCKGEDAIVFKIIGRPDLGNPCTMHILRTINWANFITKIDVMKRLKILADGRNEDANFFTRMSQSGCSIKFVNKMIAYYNKLPRIGVKK